MDHTSPEVELTHELIEAGQSGAGGWTRAQLAVLGIAFPPLKGWKAALVGTRIDRRTYEAFLDAASVRGKKGRYWVPGEVPASLF